MGVRALVILLMALLSPYMKIRGTHYGIDFGSGDGDEVVDFVDCSGDNDLVCKFLESPGNNFSFALAQEEEVEGSGGGFYLEWTHGNATVLKVVGNTTEVGEAYAGRASATFEQTENGTVVLLELFNLTLADQGLHAVSQLEDGDSEAATFEISFEAPRPTSSPPRKTLLTAPPLNDYSAVFYTPQDQSLHFNVSAHFPDPSWNNNSECSVYFRDMKFKIVSIKRNIELEFWQFSAYFKFDEGGNLILVILHMTSSDQGVYIVQCEKGNLVWRYKFLALVSMHPPAKIFYPDTGDRGKAVGTRGPVATQAGGSTGSFIFFAALAVVALVWGIGVFVYVLHRYRGYEMMGQDLEMA